MTNPVTPERLAELIVSCTHKISDYMRGYPGYVWHADIAAVLRDYQRLLGEVEGMRKAVDDYNSLLRTFHSIAERKGAVTHWLGLDAKIKDVLNKHHETWKAATAATETPIAAIDASREGK